MREIGPAPDPVFLVTRKTLHGSKVTSLEEERTVRHIIDRNFIKNEQCIAEDQKRTYCHQKSSRMRTASSQTKESMVLDVRTQKP